MSKKLQIGSDDFADVISNNLGFVDKSLFIKEILDNKGVKVTIITRPRRFGKTLNLSMLHHFLADEVCNIKTKDLFNNLKISAIDSGSYIKNHQGKYPVIFVSFKDVKNDDFDEASRNVRFIIQNLYRAHRYLLDSTKLALDEKNIFNNFLIGNIDGAMLANSLKMLAEFLCKHHDNKKVYILIDEYDTPIQAGYINNYYNKIISLMRSIFGNTLKGNEYLHRAVVTGILRVAKESLFSGLNNPQVCSVLDKSYSAHFGFTEEEVQELLGNDTKSRDDVREWYNGYNFGGTTIYNPWSIANYLDSEGIIKPYWVNTSNNDLVKKLLMYSDLSLKKQLESLLQDKLLEIPIDEGVVFTNLVHNEQAIWNILIMSGYLKVIAKTNDNPEDTDHNCSIPNKEIKILYRTIVKEWLSNNDLIRYNNFLKNLLTGDITEFAIDLQNVMLNIASVHDAAKKPEEFYHGLFLGFIAGLDPNQYECKSNKESGLGRYDISIFPLDANSDKSAIILELKSVKTKSALKKEAQKALQQIDAKQYITEVKTRKIKNVIKIGIAFSGKECVVVGEP